MQSFVKMKTKFVCFIFATLFINFATSSVGDCGKKQDAKICESIDDCVWYSMNSTFGKTGFCTNAYRTVARRLIFGRKTISGFKKPTFESASLNSTIEVPNF